MATFNESSLSDEWQLWQLFRYGPVTLFHKPQVLQETIHFLRQEHYLVHEFDCRDMATEGAILAEVVSRLGVIQDYDLTPNWAGFNDYLTDVKVPDESGLVLVFQHFDAFQSAFPQGAHFLLDIIAHAYHQNLLFGRRLIALVQTDDPHLQLEPIGAFTGRWNDKEWFIKDRGQESV
jgi:hypothetical protein